MEHIFIKAHMCILMLCLCYEEDQVEILEGAIFEDEQIRVTRLLCDPGKDANVPASASDPALLIALSPPRVWVIGPNGKASKMNLSLGQTYWQAAGKHAGLEGPGGAPAELLRIEVKTGRAGAPVGNPKAHDHSNN
jgi:hypothetical protein